MLHSQPKSTVGTPAYIAPEVLTKKEYDGKVESYSSLLWIWIMSSVAAVNHIWTVLESCWIMSQISMQVLSFYTYKIPCLKAVGRSKCSWLRAITRLWLHTVQILTYPLSQIFTFFLLFKWRGSFLYAVFLFLFANYIFIESYRLQMFGLVESPYMWC